MSFGRLGSLGRGFGRLGSGRGATSAAPVPGVLAADGGSYAWSGDTMTPMVDYKLPATGGSYAWTGQDATLTKTSLLTTWNSADKDSNITLSGGDLIATNTGSGLVSVRSIASHASGKYFASFVINTVNGGSAVGIANSTMSLASSVGGNLDSCGALVEIGATAVNGGGIGSFDSLSNGDTIDMAVDLGAELIWFRKNGGNWNASGAADPATGAGGTSFSSANAGPWFVACSANSSREWTANFGATAYPFAAPSGFGNW